MTNFVPELSPRRPSPLSIDAMTSAPSTADLMWPRPPNSDVPPMTAAAIEYSRMVPPPEFVSIERRREASTMPPSAAIIEQIAKHAIFTLSTLMPARRGGSGVAPAAGVGGGGRGGGGGGGAAAGRGRGAGGEGRGPR